MYQYKCGKSKPISFSICDSRKIPASEKFSQEFNSMKMIKQQQIVHQK
jgi:hypothetical protein